jgi:hypothetical protein
VVLTDGLRRSQAPPQDALGGLPHLSISLRKNYLN